MKERNRSIGLDIIRVLAIVSVIAGHFFLNTSFGRTPVNTVSMFVQGVVQYFFTTVGVPLFLMLTGYLNNSKTLTTGYFVKVIRVVVSYVLISLITYSVLLATREQRFSVLGLINGIGGFSIIAYGWYINMYLGLFLLIPVLNLILDSAFKDLGNRNAWFILFWGMILLTSLASTMNRYGFTLIPDYWKNAWVLNYVVLGAIIRRCCPEKPPQWFVTWRGWLWIGCFAMCLIHPFLSMILHTKDPIAILGGSADLPGMILTIVLFLSLYTCASMPCASAVQSVSRCSLDMYLFSYIIDHLVYPRITTLCPDQNKIFLYYLPVVGGIVVMSWLLSFAKGKLLAKCRFF